MNVDIHYRPVNSLARVQLDAEESIIVEPSAMVGMSPNVDMTTGMAGSDADKGGGMFGKLAKAAGRFLTGESFFQNTFTARGGPGEVLLAHTLPGDMELIELPQAGISIQSTSYVASTPGVEFSTQVGGAKTFFGGEGLFVIGATASGPGMHVLVGAFGGIEEMQCDGELIIDNGHLVAWDATLNFNLQKSSAGLVSSILSGEGMVCHFQGQGRIWMQTRNPAEYGVKVGRLLPPRQQ